MATSCACYQQVQLLNPSGEGASQAVTLESNSTSHRKCGQDIPLLLGTP